MDFCFFCYLTQKMEAHSLIPVVKTCYNQAFFPYTWLCCLTYFKDSVEKLVCKFKLTHIVQIVEGDGTEFLEHLNH